MLERVERRIPELYVLRRSWRSQAVMQLLFSRPLEVDRGFSLLAPVRVRVRVPRATL